MHAKPLATIKLSGAAANGATVKETSWCYGNVLVLLGVPSDIILFCISSTLCLSLSFFWLVHCVEGERNRAKNKAK